LEKLRKALEKAKEGRNEVYGQIAGGDARRQGQAWTPPIYTESRCMEAHRENAVENRCVCMLPDAGEIEAYKVLRTQILQRTRDKGWNTLMITSAQPGEGKTLTAVNLALTFAREFNQTVLLVDCDLKEQRIHRCLGLANGLGLADYLLDDRPLKELIVWPGIDKLTLLSGGRTIQDSTELIGSPKMKALVSEMKNRYADRYVFFDLPPVLDRADALTFGPFVDSIVMVVQADRTSIEDVKKAVELIPTEKFLGFVLNRQKKANGKR
jgi:non-specific protein-tyrosine kinase